jgi:ATP:ADP antiporter, AAA family
MSAEHSDPGVRCWLCVARFTAVLALTVAAHAILETARDSLFLAHLPPSRLPWMYLAVTVCVLLVSRLQQRATGRAASRRTFPLLLAASALVSTAIWLLRSGGPWVVAALYLWSALFSSLLLIQFWVRAEEAIGWAGAKRAFAVMAVGGPLGALFGAVLARTFLLEQGPQHLLLVSAGLTAAASAMAITLPGRRAAAPASAPASVPFRSLPGTLARDRYLRLLLVMGILAAVAATLVDFLFKQALVARLPAERIPSMIANGYLAQSAVALLVQLVAVRWLFASAGVARSLVLLPAGLFVSALGLAVGGGVAFAFLGRVLDGGLRPSLQRTGTEVLYLPLPEHRRRMFKPAVDVLSQRLGQALASVVILAAAAAGVAFGWLAAVLALVSLGWAEATRRLHPRYLDLFRERVRSGQQTPGEATAPLDLGALEALMAALSSRSDREVLAAMDLLVHYGRGKLIPALILYHPSAEVIRGALRHFSASTRTDDLPHVERLMAHSDEEVRAAVVRRWMRHHPLPAVLVELASADSSPRVRAAALVALAVEPKAEDAWRRITELAQRGTRPEQLGLASALAAAPLEGFTGEILSLAHSQDPATRSEVVRAMAALPRPAFVPELVAMLADPSLRPLARGALVACGAPALTELSRRLLENDGSPEVLREIPGTLGRFPPPRAAPVLLERLVQARGGLPRFRALRTLNRLRRDHPALALDRALLERALDVELETAVRNRRLAQAVQGQPRETGGDGPATSLLVHLLADKEMLAVERVFRVLQLIHPGERMEPIYRALRAADPELRASAEELLEELLAPALRSAVLALVRPVVPAESQSAAERARLVEALLAHRSEAVRALTIRATAELGLRQFVPRLRRLAAAASGELRGVIDQAVARLMASPRIRPA